MNFKKITLFAAIASTAFAHFATANSLATLAQDYATAHASFIMLDVDTALKNTSKEASEKCNCSCDDDNDAPIAFESNLKTGSKAEFNSFEDAFTSAIQRKDSTFVLVLMEIRTDYKDLSFAQKQKFQQNLDECLALIKKTNAKKPVILIARFNDFYTEDYVLSEVEATCVIPVTAFRTVINPENFLNRNTCLTPIVRSINDDEGMAYVVEKLQKRGIAIPQELLTACAQVNDESKNTPENNSCDCGCDYDDCD